jgi:hypothetical protein
MALPRIGGCGPCVLAVRNGKRSRPMANLIAEDSCFFIPLAAC